MDTRKKKLQWNRFPATRQTFFLCSLKGYGVPLRHYCRHDMGKAFQNDAERRMGNISVIADNLRSLSHLVPST